MFNHVRSQIADKLDISLIPGNVRTFLAKAFILFIAWKLLYHVILLPTRFPDNILTNITAKGTAALYHTFFSAEVVVIDSSDISHNYSCSYIYVNSRKAIGIADPCNGLELYILYLGFLLCIPENFIKSAIYISLGIFGIFILNILRCTGIAWLNLHYISLSDFAHHYFFKMIIYGLIFYIWVLFSRKYFNE